MSPLPAKVSAALDAREVVGDALEDAYEVARQLHYGDVYLAPVKPDGTPDFALEGTAHLKPDPMPDELSPEDIPRLCVVREAFYKLSEQYGKAFGYDCTTLLVYRDATTGEPRYSQIRGPTSEFEDAKEVLGRILGGEAIRTIPRSAPKAANDNFKLASAPPAVWPGIVSSGELVRRFTPPDYAIDGIVQTGFLYSVTASTGTGKTAVLLLISALAAQGLPLGNREVRRGRVIYFAGENPDDVTMRWIAAAHHSGFDLETIDVHFVPGTFDITKAIADISAAVDRLGGADLIVVDTSAAYFQGADENANVDMARHARNLRELTTLPGSPCVLVACHPTKAADQSNLLPRGGGAFIAEVDGNLTCQRTDAGTVKLHWQGKHRGPDFDPVYFDLHTVTAPTLVDSRGRTIPTVMATVVSEGEMANRSVAARSDEDEVLITVQNSGPVSASRVAELLQWNTDRGETHKRRAQTALDRLRRDKLLRLDRDGWRVEKAGHEAAAAARSEMNQRRVIDRSVTSMIARSAERRREPQPFADSDHD